jgi:Protein of unknown function (DUF2442)
MLMVRHDEFEKANTRAVRRLTKGPTAVGARYDRRSDRVVVQLNNDVELSFSPRVAQVLESAKPAQLAKIEISPSGLGLHWPKLDADLYLPALMEGALGSKRWMAARLGSRGGRVRSEAKAVASRENGKLGGRPRKRVVETA